MKIHYFAMCIAIIATQANCLFADAAPPLPQIPARTFTITDYGAVGDGTTVNSAAITKAITAARDAGGGSVVIPAGRFLTAAFTLASNIDLHLDKGATLLFSNKFDDYPKEKERYVNLISATNCEDISITGEGTIDGQGQPWWDAFLKTKNATGDEPRLAHRPFMIVLKDCTRVLVKDVTLTNSPSFHLVPEACRDVTIDHVNIIAPPKAPNTDGIDPSGWNFLFTHCTFDEGDDCIAIKASGKAPAGHVSCEDFLVTDCTFKHGHGMSIGSQGSGGLRRLTVRDSTFDSTDSGIRLKSNRSIGGLIEDCTYENLTMTNVKTPVYITSYYPEKETPKSPADDPAKPVTATTPHWRNIHIKNVTATNSGSAGKLIGLAEMPIENLEFENVQISADKPMELWNCKGIHFSNSIVKVSKGDAIEIQQSSEVTGIDPKTGQAD